jgi:hypothetical protein
MKVIEGYETIMFKSKFNEWPATPELKLSSEDGRGKVAGYCLQIYQFQCKRMLKFLVNNTYLPIILLVQLSLKVKD